MKGCHCDEGVAANCMMIKYLTSDSGGDVTTINRIFPLRSEERIWAGNENLEFNANFEPGLGTNNNDGMLPLKNTPSTAEPTVKLLY